MTTGYGITGIGYPLGNIGLGSTGTYMSYDNYMPSMIGMNPMTAGMGYGMNNSIFGMGGMGYYNPMFMAQMQQQVEASQIAHAGSMHTAVLNNELKAHRFSDSTLINKILTNGDIQQGVQNLHAKVLEGDQDGICAEFDKLKNYIFVTYKDELKSKGDKINPSTAVTQIIEVVYGNIISAQNGGKVADLRSDIKKHGDGAAMNGFMSGLRSGHHERYVDETLNHCFGLEVDQRASKEFKRDFGNGIGRIVSTLEKGVYGAGAAAVITGVGTGLYKGLTPDPDKVVERAIDKATKGQIFPDEAAKKAVVDKAKSTAKSKWYYKLGNSAKNVKWGNTLKTAGQIGLVIGLVGDIVWQLTRAEA